MRDSRSVAPRRARPDFGSPAYVPPQYQTKIWGRIIFALLILVLIGIVVGGGGVYWQLHKAQGSGSKPVAFHVGTGDTVSTIADRLHGEGFVNSTLLFRLDARLQGLSGKLKVGDYTLRHDMSIDDIVAALAVYRDKMMTFTIPEGWRATQIAARLQRDGISPQKFLKEVDAPTMHAAVLADKPKGKPLEGYLFPDTYTMSVHSSARDVVRLMVRQLSNSFTPAMRQDAARQHWSVYQILTLASIIEREARVPQERPIIASVYLNRLHTKGWVLNADPTIQYALGTPKKWWPILTLDDLKKPGPYNTYINAGLPPTPIANPGLASIMAVLHPKATGYFYFVAKNDGSGRHAFARTLAEQQANITKYQH